MGPPPAHGNGEDLHSSFRPPMQGSEIVGATLGQPRDEVLAHVLAVPHGAGRAVTEHEAEKGVCCGCGVCVWAVLIDHGVAAEDGMRCGGVLNDSASFEPFWYSPDGVGAARGETAAPAPERIDHAEDVVILHVQLLHSLQVGEVLRQLHVCHPLIESDALGPVSRPRLAIKEPPQRAPPELPRSHVPTVQNRQQLNAAPLPVVFVAGRAVVPSSDGE
mmetsp:Transcript_37695/g.94538  ORF Transcript_37695/g.94538 Transcript_37695/m.94538 type:complete len:218 (+) Transcript_37695:491-1144(+)